MSKDERRIRIGQILRVYMRFVEAMSPSLVLGYALGCVAI
jgi:hypothetical protein